MPVQLVSIMGGGLAGQSATFLRGLGKIFWGIYGEPFRCTICTKHMKAFENLPCGEIALIIIMLITIIIVIIIITIIIVILIMITSLIVIIITIIIMMIIIK